MALPVFRYHPDPLATGSIVASDNTCQCCDRKRDFIYAGPVYAEEEWEEAICPWCIADGSAAEKMDATFVDAASIEEDDNSVPPEVVDTISCRTPGFAGWQQERWLTCCADAAAFLGPVGRAELENFGPEAQAAVREECGLEGSAWDEYYQALNRDNGPTAYLFRCLHCSRFLAYSDSA